ncbi:hypothetical protein [Streptomyces sp. NBC_00564]|nr:hypothetical protein OG256_34730 [Streptomyces sp. NBC_00564]
MPGGVTRHRASSFGDARGGGHRHVVRKHPATAMSRVGACDP